MRTPIEYPRTDEEMYQRLKDRLGDMLPDAELWLKAKIAVKINALKREKKAIILGHNYMEPALFHSVPDYTGDSLELSRIAAEVTCDTIVFCGVRFMAETAKILNPNRRVLLPSPRGGCSLAAGIDPTDITALKAHFPGVPVVTYVNTYAEVKALSDYCCTSSNGEAVVRHLRAEGHERILFLPDEYLAANVAKQCGLPMSVVKRDSAGKIEVVSGSPTSGIIGWEARCEVHEQFTLGDIERVRGQFDDVKILAHPECRPEVVAASDYSGSTTEMIKYVAQMDEGRYLLLTECSMGDNIAAKSPEREMLRLCSVRCPHMNEIRLHQTLECLREDQYPIEIDPKTQQDARRALQRMIAIGQ